MSPAPPGPKHGEIARAVARLVLSLAALLAGIALAAYVARDQLDALGHAFVQRFGVAGMFAGVYLADAFSFPVPPQFYLFTVIAGGSSQVVPIAAICTASVLAGITGYHLAGRLARFRLFAERIEVVRPRLDRLFERYGYWAIVVASVTPIPFSMLCYLGGLYRLPARYFAVHLALRVPRILVYYTLIRLGWAQGF